MDLNSLNLKWNNILSFHDKEDYKALRISSECLPDLFLAIDKYGHKCLLLSSPEPISTNTTVVEKSKLKLTNISNKGITIIALLDRDFNDLFNDLILSIYYKISSISDPKVASRELLSTFHKWSEFFEDSLNKRLSNEDVMGLYGELFVLKEKIKEGKDVNLVLKAWKGPFDTTNDFVFDSKNIEVKTKLESKPYIKIASEYQLEKEFDKELELHIVAVSIDLNNGESIHEILVKIVDEIRKNLGDLTILYKALNQKGLTIENSNEYNNHKFRVIKVKSFRVSAEGFPRLSKSNIHEGISKLKYKIRVNSLTPFLIEEKLF